MATRYALGDRPTAVDAVLLGGLRAHIHHDPVPDISHYERVVEWCEKGADRWDGGGELAPCPDSTPLARHLLELARAHYRPFALANRSALAAGEKSFVVETYGEPTSYLARGYPEQSRQLLIEHIRNQLDDDERATVERWLDDVGLANYFAD